MAYDDASHGEETIDAGIQTGAASATINKFYRYRATVLKAVHAVIVTAGTNASAKFDIYNGTTSVGTLAVGTNTAGSVVTATAINASVPAGSFIELKGAANSATAQAAVQLVVQLND
jgi:hypothetical protein